MPISREDGEWYFQRNQSSDYCKVGNGNNLARTFGMIYLGPTSNNGFVPDELAHQCFMGQVQEFRTQGIIDLGEPM